MRRAAVESLASLEDVRVLAALAAALHDSAESVRSAAARALSQIEVAAAAPLLHKALADPAPWVRYHAVRSIGRQRYSPCANHLVQLASEDPAMQVRVAAVETLGQLGIEGPLSLFAALADGDDGDLARAALGALGAAKCAEALPPLLAALDSTLLARRLAALAALSESGRGSGNSTSARGRRSRPGHRGGGGRRSGSADRTGGRGRADRFDRSAGPPRSVHCGSGQPVPERGALIARGLRHELLDVRRATVDALTRSNHPRAVEWLGPALDDEHAAIRFAALTALMLAGHGSVRTRAASLAISDPDSAVRRAAHGRLPR